MAAADIATLALKLEATQFQAEAKKAQAALTGVASTAEAAQARVTRSFTVGQTSGLRGFRAQATEQTRIIKEHLDWRIAAERQAADLQAFIARRTATETAAAMKTTAAATATVEVAARKSTLRLGELRESLGSLAARTAGVHAVFGRFANVLGGFALGSLPMVAVLAGVAALGAAYRKLTEETRKAKEEQEKFRDKMADLAQRQRVAAAGGESAVDYKRAAREYEQAEARVFALGRAQEELRKSWQAANMTAAWWSEIARRSTRASEELATATRNLAAAKKRLTDQEREAGAEMNRTAIEIIRDATREAERETDRRIRAAERAAEEEIRLMREVEAERQRIANYRLSVARNTVRTNPLAVSGGGVVYGPTISQAQIDEMMRWGRSGGGTSTSGSGVPWGDVGRVAAGGVSQAPGGIGFMGSLAAGALGGGLVGALGAATAGVVGFVKELFGAGKAAREAARQLRESLGRGLVDWQAELSGSDYTRGVIAARRRFDELYAAAEKLGDEGLKAEVVETYNLALQELNKQQEAAARAAQELADAEAEREKALIAQTAAVREDWQVRLLRAQGDEDGAAALERYLVYNRALAETTDEVTREIIKQTWAAEEWREALRKAEEEQQEAARAAEQAADAMREMAAEAQRLSDALTEAFYAGRSFADDLTVRRARLGGDEREIALAEFRVRFQTEMEAALKLLDAGTITREQYDELAQILTGELYAALDAIADRAREAAEAAEREARAAAEAAEAEARRNAEMERSRRLALEDLQVRRLTAMGDVGGAEAERLRLSQERELAEAITSGMSAEYLAALREVLALERQAFEQEQEARTSAAVDGATDAARTVSRYTAGISETTAVRMADLTMTSNIWLAEIALNTRGLRRGTDGAALPLVGGQAPSVTVSVNNYAPITSGQTPGQIGEAIGKGVSRYLKRDSDAYTRASGDAAV